MNPFVMELLGRLALNALALLAGLALVALGKPGGGASAARSVDADFRARADDEAHVAVESAETDDEVARRHESTTVILRSADEVQWFE